VPRSIQFLRRQTGGVAILAATTALAAGLMSGCSAGQKTQTDTMVPAVPGVNADSADHTIGLRDVTVVHDGQGYPKGGTAPLAVRIFNRDPVKGVTLVKVTSDQGMVVLVGGPAATSSAPAPSASATARPSGSASASPTASPSPTAVGSATISVPVPASTVAVLTAEAGRYLAVTGLAQPLLPGMSLKLSFTFDNGAAIDLDVPMSPPASAGSRSPLPLNSER
jgi:hypothetical protein